jgi:uncharacterized protein (TIGR01777 family)
MRILISGGSGMLGQAIVKDSLFQNDEFIILSRKPEMKSISDRVMYQYWNPDKLDGWQNDLHNIDIVINLAGENIGDGLWTQAKKVKILSSRVNAGKTLADAVLAMKPTPTIFMQASAVGFYGSRAGEKLSESSEKGCGFLSDVCAQWEASSAVVEDHGIRRIILRTGVVLSLETGILPRLSLPVKFFIGGNLGNGEQFVPWLHMDDFASMVHFLIHHKPANGVFNLCSQPVTFSEFGNLLARKYNRPYWLPVPGFVLKILLGEMSTLVLDSQRVMPDKLTAMGYQYRYADLKQALESFA